MNKEQQFEQDYKDYVNRRRAHLAAHVTPAVITYLEEEFQTNLPCYLSLIHISEPTRP